jgi:signal transduction histidine kinase
MVVVLIMLLWALVLFILDPYFGIPALVATEVNDPLASLVTRFLTNIFPILSVMVILTVIAITLALPPSAIFSFIVARQTTRRLEKLATAARALKGGNYGARVTVTGEDEVAQVQSTFNAMAETMQLTLGDLQRERDTVARLLQSRRELIANVSHELRTPVATVRAALDSTLDRWEEIPHDILRHDLQVAEGEITRLQGLIDDLFTLARAEVGGLKLECKPAEVGPLVQRMVEAVAPLAWRAGRVQVVAEVPKKLPQACVDAERLQQVLINLLRNGVRHTPPGGIVAAIAAPEEAYVRIEVRDTGEGIAPDDLPHIWERFYRGDNTHTHEEGGAGLGLALVKELTEAMGGTVSVESESGRGSCFVLRLPRT